NGRIKKPGDLPPDLPARIRDRIVPDDKGYKFVLAETNQGVAVTQKDISELQLGKGAIRAGIAILMEKLNLATEDLDGIMLAGAFGSNLNPQSVRDIGLLPPVELNRIESVGNAAGLGVLMSLLDQKQMQTALNLSKQVEHVELSLHTGFQRKFAKAISF
ncbi:MAG: ASKHA domain-containing protein, partial [Desulfotomaculaceae bacterium]